MARKPKPFRRPHVEVGEHGREWQELSPLKLSKGDVVAERGLVVDTDTDESGFHVKYFSGTVEDCTEESPAVKVFARKVFSE